MTSLSNEQIRRMILEILYEEAKTNPTSQGVNRDEMKKILQIPEKDLDFNVFYLKEKGLIELFQCLGKPWEFAKINAYGIDVVENKEKYRTKFPFIYATIQEIHGNIYGQVVQAVASQLTFSQRVDDAFKQAYQLIDMKTEIQSELRGEIKKRVKLLEEELRNPEPNLSKIQELWKWLKQNANWIIPTLTQIVLEVVKIAFGIKN
jgi:hypothetical protein